jgi:thermitase
VYRRPLALVLAALGVLSLASPVGAAERSRPFEGWPRERPVRAAGETPSAEVPPGEHPVRAAAVPDDDLYWLQWGAKTVGMEAAWDVTTGEASTVIAVVDSGVDTGFVDLDPRLLPGWDFVDDDADPSDPFGHGTFVALIAAAGGFEGNAQVGDIAGYCWECRILPVRVLDGNGEGDTGVVADGIVYAVDNGADIINLSLTSKGSSQSLEDAIEYAQANDVLVVAASGNQMTPYESVTEPRYPAALPGVVSVSASGRSDKLFPWSFRGSWSQVAAPGCLFYDPDFGYDFCGTSFASPAVAGILGLGMSVDPLATDEALVNALYTSVKAISGVAHGRVSASKFLTMLADDVEATRVSGTNRINTAIALSQRAFPGGATDVVIARADSYADGLAAAPLAGAKGAPLLLTGSTSLSSAVKAEINRLGATTAWLIGGEGALSTAVETGLATTTVTEVHRLEGANRYDTAGAIGEQVDADVGGTTVDVVSAGGFADAVAVSNLAAKEQAPILLVTKDGVPQDTWDSILAIAPENIVVVGGTTVVDDGVVTELENETGATVERVAGLDRYDTSRQLAERAVLAGLDEGKIWVATGTNWPDALAAGPDAAAAGAVLLLTSPTSATMVNTWLDGVVATEVVVVGGVLSVRDATMYSMQAHLD